MDAASFGRTGLLLGNEARAIFGGASVLVFGLGGVGSYAVEAMARCGVGKFVVVDNDVVTASNINRQLLATASTIGAPKVELAKRRIMDINPEARVEAIQMFYRPEESGSIDWGSADAVLDAIDTTRAKMDIAVRCQELGIPLVSCMGMGNRMDPTQVRIGDLAETSGDHLCRVMRKKLRAKYGIEHLTVVYSLETPIETGNVRIHDDHSTAKRPTSGSSPFVPAAGGMAMAYAAMQFLLEQKQKRETLK